jgi:hypothetical protein
VGAAALAVLLLWRPPSLETWALLLEGLDTLVWPAVAVWAVLFFRREIAGLAVRAGGAERGGLRRRLAVEQAGLEPVDPAEEPVATEDEQASWPQPAGSVSPDEREKWRLAEAFQERDEALRELRAELRSLHDGLRDLAERLTSTAVPQPRRPAAENGVPRDELTAALISRRPFDILVRDFQIAPDVVRAAFLVSETFSQFRRRLFQEDPSLEKRLRSRGYGMMPYDHEEYARAREELAATHV